MFNRFIKSFSFSAILIASFVFTQTAQAQPLPEIVVNFNPNPLFGESNFLPGQTSQSSISIQNNSQTNRSVAIEAINISDPDNFGGTLQLRIEDSNQVYFNNTLADFFDQGLVNLSALAAGNSADYNLTVNFISSTGNDYQNKTLGFDIQLVFTGEDGEGGEPIIIASSGGGGGSGITTLNIFNELASNQTTNSALISWFTNLAATSRVIYSSEQDPHNFLPASLPNYGYLNSTTENSSLVTFREINLAGLEADTLYYYRVISHRSGEADTVSPEHSFRTAGVLGEKIIASEDQDYEDRLIFVPPALAGKIQPLVKGIKEFFNPVQAQEASSSEPVVNQVDTLIEIDNTGELVDEFICTDHLDVFWYLILVYILGLLLNYFSKRRRYTFILFVLLAGVTALLAFLFCPGSSMLIWLAIVLLFLFNLWCYLSSFNLRYHRWPVFIIFTLYLIAVFLASAQCFCHNIF